VPLAANASAVLGVAAAPKADWRTEWLCAELLDGDRTIARNLWFGRPPKAFAFPDPGLTAQLDPHPDGGFTVHLAARALAWGLQLSLDGLDPDAQWEDNHLALIPGESRPLRLLPSRPIPLAQARQALRLRLPCPASCQ